MAVLRSRRSVPKASARSTASVESWAASQDGRLAASDRHDLAQLTGPAGQGDLVRAALLGERGGDRGQRGDRESAAVACRRSRPGRRLAADRLVHPGGERARSLAASSGLTRSSLRTATAAGRAAAGSCRRPPEGWPRWPAGLGRPASAAATRQPLPAVRPGVAEDAVGAGATGRAVRRSPARPAAAARRGSVPPAGRGAAGRRCGTPRCAPGRACASASAAAAPLAPASCGHRRTAGRASSPGSGAGRRAGQGIARRATATGPWQARRPGAAASAAPRRVPHAGLVLEHGQLGATSDSSTKA